MGIEAALPAGRELLNVTEYLHIDRLPAMVHLFVEGRETARCKNPRAGKPSTSLAWLLWERRPEMGASRRREYQRTKDERNAPKRPRAFASEFVGLQVLLVSNDVPLLTGVKSWNDSKNPSA